MNEPIISPWLIYWVGRLDIIHGFCCIVGFFLTVIAFLAGIIKLVDCKCKLNKIYQATISVEYTLSRKVSNSSSGL